MTPTVDRFASDKNYKCKRFFSKIPQEGAIGVNFFTQKLYEEEIYWLCPPPKLVIDVFKHIAHFPNVTVIIVIPVWKCSNFWPFIVCGGFFHPMVEKILICDPFFIPNNEASNLFSGKKKFQTLALLTKTNTFNKQWFFFYVR